MRRVMWPGLIVILVVFGVLVKVGMVRAATTPPKATAIVSRTATTLDMGMDLASDFDIVLKSTEGKLTSAKLMVKMSNANAEIISAQSKINGQVFDLNNTANKITFASGILTINVTTSTPIDLSAEEGVKVATVKVWGKVKGTSALNFYGGTGNIVNLIPTGGTAAVKATTELKNNGFSVVPADYKASWKMDEEAGNVVADAKGFYPAYSSTNSIQASKAGFGMARNFALGDTINIKASPMSLNNAFTVSVWVKPNNCFGSTTNAASRITKFVSQEGGFVLGERIQASGDCRAYGKVFIGSTFVEIIGDANNKVPKTPTWTHLTLSWDGSKMRLSRNGTTVAEKTSAGLSYNSVERIVMGAPKFTGMMDNLQVYNKALSVSEVSSLYSGQPGVLANAGNVGAFTMDETSGSAVVDSSSLANNGVANMGGITGGISGNARSFNGVNTSIGTTKVLAAGSTFSVIAWVKPTIETMGSKAGIVQTSESAGFSLTASTDGRGYRAMVKNKMVEGGTLVLNKWQLIALTYRPNSSTDGKMTLYVDGVEVGNASIGPLGTTGYKVLIGKNGTSVWTGLIDEVGVFNNALSSEDIKKRYDDTKGTEAPSCHANICPDKPDNLHVKGDANCDGKVDIYDYSLWSIDYFGDSKKGEVGRTNWRTNFNCEVIRVGDSKPDIPADDKVDYVDYSIWLSNKVLQ